MYKVEIFIVNLLVLLLSCLMVPDLAFGRESGSKPPPYETVLVGVLHSSWYGDIKFLISHMDRDRSAQLYIAYGGMFQRKKIQLQENSVFLDIPMFMKEMQDMTVGDHHSIVFGGGAFFEFNVIQDGQMVVSKKRTLVEQLENEKGGQLARETLQLLRGSGGDSIVGGGIDVIQRQEGLMPPVRLSEQESGGLELFRISRDGYRALEEAFLRKDAEIRLVDITKAVQRSRGWKIEPLCVMLGERKVKVLAEEFMVNALVRYGVSPDNIVIKTVPEHGHLYIDPDIYIRGYEKAGPARLSD